jgi:ubiquinone/menaquinone biosynthesis C-methylase UbiE
LLAKVLTFAVFPGAVMSDTAASIRHYTSDDLLGRIMAALAAAGHDVSNPTVEILYRIDQLHGGGLNSTKAQAERIPIGKETRILDAGCGIGGASRYLAQTYGCSVEAIDITPQYVEVAARLNALCGMSDRIAIREGSVTDLPYPDQSFDVVWSQNVTMNVGDKRRMFAEAFRVLVPGGVYTFSHLAQGPNGAPYYPLPWARDASYSFLETPERILDWLSQAGFIDIENRREGSSAQTPRPQGDLGPATVMGDDMPIRNGNSGRSVAEGRLVPMLVVARRPAK